MILTRFRPRLGRTFTVVLAVAMAASCRTATTDPRAPLMQPGSPGQPSRAISRDAATDLSRVGFSPADVVFMQGMIGHHAQALDMTALIAERTARQDMKLLGKRIELSQADEIGMMRRWLQDRGQAVPDAHAHHAHDYKLMPGMLSPDEMAALAAAKGPEFDRLFLEGMIKHHGGALTMVNELFATKGAAQESDMFAFATDIVADQQMEIDRMTAMLNVR